MTSPTKTGLRAVGLTKRYGGRTVVDDLTFTVRPGEITGFLGPNGAGKSTTLRMLAGLTRPSSGHASVDGRRPQQVADPSRLLGVLLDAGAVHDGRTVAETMRIVTQTMGLPRAAGEEMLDRVGLGGVTRRRAGALSLGMRQRLGLALAMVGRPRYLVLDEPMNGLDIEGMSWIKRVLRDFADGGGGALLSTHLLGEVGGLADRVVVIDCGRMVTEARPDELGGTVRSRARSADDTQFLAALQASGHVVVREPSGLVVDAPPEAVGRIALAAGVPLVELTPLTVDLTAFVLQNTRGEFAAASSRAGGTPIDHHGGPQ